MMEMVIHGRGGRGGVTLAKLIAAAYFKQGKQVQAFGVYGAERTGAPVQAFVRVDDDEICVHSAVVAPDHVIVIDPSLVVPGVLAGASTSGWVIINTAKQPEEYALDFPGRQVAVIDADTIALVHHLGTKALPIVNTALLGAVARVMDIAFEHVEGALAEAGFAGSNTEAARDACRSVATARLPGAVSAVPRPQPRPAMGFFHEAVGSAPATLTGSWASRRPRTHESTAPCTGSCPAGNDVRGFVHAAEAGDMEAALSIVLETSPFPGVCGRVCPAPCMADCSRCRLDEAVNVRQIERAVAERGILPPTKMASVAERVGIVGGGPAGLTAAYHLSRLGHRVTVYESGSDLGGLLRTGIPEYRLPRAVLDREIEHILSYGVEVRTGSVVDRGVLHQLASEYAAVFVAPGQQVRRALSLDGVQSGIVAQGLDFLDPARRGDIDLSGRDVVVMGGGNTAMDAARTALRLGAADVRVAYRRTCAEMPAIVEEVAEAREEGVRIEELTAPSHFLSVAGRTVLACRRMRLGPPDESGRPHPEPVDGPDASVEYPCDYLLLALGQQSDLSLLPEMETTWIGGKHLEGGGALVCVGGDFVGGEGTVAAAIGSGRRAALAIHANLSGEDWGGVADSPSHDVCDESAGPDVVRWQSFPRSPQHRPVMAPVDARRRDFSEVCQGLVDGAGADAVRAEAARCFTCGTCTACQACVAYCPEGALQCAATAKPDFDYDYCKGCGLCAYACPRGALSMEAV